MDCDEGVQRPELLASLQHPSWVTSLAFKGNVLAAASSDGLVTLWRVPVGDKLASLRPGSPTCALGISAEFVACGSRDGTVAVYANPAGHLLMRLSHEQAVSAIAFEESDRGCCLVTGSEDHCVLGWLLPSGEQVFKLLFSESIGSLSFSGHYLAVGCDDGELSIWSVSPVLSVERLLTLSPPGARAWATSTVLCGDILACARSDRTVDAFRIPSGERLFSVRVDDMVLSVAMCGRVLGCGSRDGKTMLIRLPQGRPLLPILQDSAEHGVGEASECGPVPIYAVAMEDDLLACAPNDGRVTVWRVSDDELLRCLGQASFDDMP